MVQCVVWCVVSVEHTGSVDGESCGWRLTVGGRGDGGEGIRGDGIFCGSVDCERCIMCTIRQCMLN